MKFIGSNVDIDFSKVTLSTALCDASSLKEMGDLSGDEAEAINKIESAKSRMQTNEYIGGELISYYKTIVEAINHREDPDA